MSKRESEIGLALEEKGLNASYLGFDRAIQIPGGGTAETTGWNIRLDAQSEALLIERGEDPELPQFHSIVDALAWIDGLPDCRLPVAA